MELVASEEDGGVGQEDTDMANKVNTRGGELLCNQSGIVIRPDIVFLKLYLNTYFLYVFFTLLNGTYLMGFVIKM